ncbi:MAG: signal peptidase I [Solirubrobacteraceae bacterium]
MARGQKKSGSGSLLELVVIVATALGLALGVQAFLIKPYRIPSESMEPTLDVGQRVLVNRIGNRFSKPEVGSVMVFHPPTGSEQEVQCGNPNQGQGHPQPCATPTKGKADVNFIKRVVAGPGDRVAIRQGRVIRNGRPVKEGFIRECGGGADCNFPQEITIPPDHWYMMGDNRGQSDDSRFWGPVPRKWFIGGAFATYWPPKRLGLL